MGHTRIVAHEQNAYAGRITRLASKMGVPVASGWASCEPLRKTAYSNTGIPVRLFRRMERREAWHELEIPVERSARQTVLVMTGSLGSEGIRSVMSSVCRDARMQDWTCLIVGAAGDVTERVAENAFLLPKRWDASPFFSAADVAITRGGASTLSEVAAMDLPSVVIPWRGASDDHQMKNAQCFAMDHKSIVWDEKSGQIDDLVKNLNDLCRFSRAQSGLSNKKMYNATESTCAKLWRLLIPCEKGEIHVGGR